MKRLSLILLCFVGSIIAAVGQQRPVQSLYMFDPLLINPAYAGDHVQLSATAIYRNQWVNLDGAPKTITATVHSGFYKSKMGLGVILSNDQIGVHNDLSFYGIYSYKIKLTNKTTLAMGIQGGFNNLRSDYNKLNLKAPGDPNLAGVLQKFNPNVGTGFFLRHKNAFFGVSVPQIISNKVFDVNNETDVSMSRQKRYYYAFGGFTAKVADNISVYPSFLARFQDDAPLSFDINTTVIFYNAVGFGASYRAGEGFVGLFELQLNENFHVGYAYDFTTSQLARYSNGSHEIMVNYRVKIQKIHRGLPCPTYW
jgi:type IX secretion system PorP/SprF family membrane protein